MKRIVTPAILWMLLFISFEGTAQINADLYLWEYPSHRQVAAPEELTDRLMEEIQKILDTGYLSPLSIRYTDQMWESYLLYREPARIMQTLAEAWPVLDSNQKIQVRDYIHQMFLDPEQQFWIQPSYPNRVLPADYGVPRTIYPSENIYGDYGWWGNYRPTIQLIYQFWNYVYRTGDTSLVTMYYEDIRSFYELKLGYYIDPGNLYGTMCAHIGMARLAHMMNDQPMISLAKSMLEEFLQEGLNLSAIDENAYLGKDGWNAPYPYQCDGGEYCPRKDDFIYRGFIFLNLSPEIGRFLKNHVLNQTLERHESAFRLFPFWWLVDAPHWTRWAGDETVGIPSEMFGMVMPVEKWVKNSPGPDLEPFFLSSPKGTGDCYWLEGLVLAIEAFGEDEWKDVRNQPFTFELAETPPLISQQPQSQQVLSGETASFSVSIQGTAQVTYAWLGPDGLISDTSGASITIQPVSLNHSGKYYCKISGSFGTITSDTAILTVYVQQFTEIPSGWSGISSWLIPLDQKIEEVLEPIAENLVLLQNGQDFYWPDQQINTLINWNPMKGYLIKTLDNVPFNFNGVPFNPGEFSLNPGWNLFPVLTECPLPCATLSNLTGGKLIMILEAAGNRVYWPGYGIFTLTGLHPGKSYWVLMSQDLTFEYPGCSN